MFLPRVSLYYHSFYRLSCFPVYLLFACRPPPTCIVSLFLHLSLPFLSTILLLPIPPLPVYHPTTSSLRISTHLRLPLSFLFILPLPLRHRLHPLHIFLYLHFPIPLRTHSLPPHSSLHSPPSPGEGRRWELGVRPASKHLLEKCIPGAALSRHHGPSHQTSLLCTKLCHPL